MLVEFTYEFCRFETSVLMKHVRGGYRMARFLSGVRRAASGGSPLGPRGADFGVDYRAASSDEWVRELTAIGDPEFDAFEMLSRSYNLFGLPESLIPFNENRRVVPEEIGFSSAFHGRTGVRGGVSGGEARR